MTAPADPRHIGELLGDWLAIRMDEVDALADEARAKVAAIPDQRACWSVVGELLLRVAVLEQDVAALKKAARR
ncbi:MAG TPA: hypothetical protein VG276_30955 [Actinomycetes bacterium]|nr:hypothetical protein [Actinomycetes bacterium]